MDTEHACSAPAPVWREPSRLRVLRDQGFEGHINLVGSEDERPH